MKKIKLADTFIYRWRYQLSYLLIGLILIVALALAGLYSPGGLTDSEQQTTIATSQLNLLDPATLGTVNLPYHLLQKASFEALGIAQITIKLPSLLLALASAFGMLLLLRRWFNANVAVLTAIVAISTGQFLLIAQSGTPAIMLIFWPTIILLLATLISQSRKLRSLRQILLALSIGLSLYTPLMIYIVVALGITCLLHPKLRYQIRHALNTSWLAPVLLGLMLAAPIAAGVYQNPDFGLRLLGIPAEMPNLRDSSLVLIRNYLDVFSPTSGRLMTPVYGLGALALMALGAARLFKSRYTIRSYTIVAWTLLIIPFLILQPEFSIITFVPLMLILAIGIDTLIRRWYMLFPYNPYARIAGLVPLVVLISTLTMTGIERYFYGYHYDPQTAGEFSNDLRLLQTTVHDDDSKFSLVTGTASEADFYKVVLDDMPFKSQINLASDQSRQADTTYIYTRSALDKVPADDLPSKIVVNGRSSSSDRLYIYKDESK